MPIPDLTPIAGGVLHSTGQGVPTNGNNVFKLGLDPELVDPDWLTIVAIAKGPSVSAVGDATYDPATGNITLPVTQSGTDQLRVYATVTQSSVR